jgi:hypothetical protein
MNFREFALAGGLISYGTSLVGEDRLATDKPETPDGKKVAPGPAGTGVYLEANDGCPLHNDEPTHKQNIPAYTDGPRRDLLGGRGMGRLYGRGDLDDIVRLTCSDRSRSRHHHSRRSRRNHHRRQPP